MNEKESEMVDLITGSDGIYYECIKNHKGEVIEAKDVYFTVAAEAAYGAAYDAKTKQKIMDYAVKLLEDKKWKKIKFM